MAHLHRRACRPASHRAGEAVTPDCDWTPAPYHFANPGGFEGYFAELAAAFPARAAIEPATVAAIQWRYDTYPPGT